MNYKIGTSDHKSCEEAVTEATRGLDRPKLIIFCSAVNQFEQYTQLIKKAFPETMVIGLTTYIALCKGGAYKNRLLVAGIESGIECYGGVLEEIDKYPFKYAGRVKESLNKFMQTDNTVCLEFTTGLIKGEESVMTTLNSALEDKCIPVFGGTAGDDTKIGYTLVSYNGQVYQNSCVFVMIRNLVGKVKIYRENIYKLTQKHHIATKVDTNKRIVYEYDHKPAAKVMADDLGVSMNELPKFLDQHPWGRIMGDKFYITANQEILKGGAIAYHARVYKNAQMVLLELDNYKEINKQTLKQIQSDIPHPSLTIVVHCLARSLLFEGEGYINEFARKIGSDLGSFIGISGYGEQEGRQHFNQTMVVAVFE